ncbi:MAG TPA: hypothetical protein VM890_01395 [Longimicrobium sp.]|nr:hypothetical protein [Longimicrobium sp.]
MTDDTPLVTLRFAIKRDGTPVLSATRRDGSVAWQRQKHFFPVHDLGHYAIESVLGLRQAFWGMMADGWDFTDFGTPWPRGPMPNVPEALLAEVTAGWLDNFAHAIQDDESGAAELNAHLAAWCAQHGHPTPRVVTADELARILTMRADLARRWHALAPGEAMELRFPADG